MGKVFDFGSGSLADTGFRKVLKMKCCNYGKKKAAL